MVEIWKIREHEEKVNEAAEWFNDKWKVPVEAYKESMEMCLKQENAVPQWYIAVEHGRIIGGLGVIENDFHKRKDLLFIKFSLWNP